MVHERDLRAIHDIDDPEEHGRWSCYLHSDLLLLFVSHHGIFSGFWMCTLQIRWIKWRPSCCRRWKSTIEIISTTAFWTEYWNREWHSRKGWSNWAVRIHACGEVMSLVRRICVFVHMSWHSDTNRWNHRSNLSSQMKIEKGRKTKYKVRNRNPNDPKIYILQWQQQWTFNSWKASS